MDRKNSDPAPHQVWPARGCASSRGLHHRGVVGRRRVQVHLVRLVAVLTAFAFDRSALGAETSASSPIDLLGALTNTRPIGTPAPAGYRVAGGFPTGWLVGADLGLAAPLAGPGQASGTAWAVGTRVGYQYANGLSWMVRFDDERIGLAPQTDPGLLSLTGGIRYNFPYLWPSPFVELDGGGTLLSVAAGGATPGGTDILALCGAAAVGLSFPIFRYFSLDLTGRGWLAVGPQGALVTFTVQGGMSIVFGFPGRAP